MFKHDNTLVTGIVVVPKYTYNAIPKIEFNFKENELGASGGTGYVDYWIVKVNSSGAKQWDKTYGGTGSDTFYSVAKTSNGYLLVGYTGSNDGDIINGNNGGRDGWILRITETGLIN